MKESQAILKQALFEFKPVARYVGFSGGNDSLALAHYVMNNFDGFECFHIRTGIGIPRTYEFIQDTCKTQNWPLVVIDSKKDCGQDYDAIVMRHGFPGPAGHQYMYARLKERAVRMLVRRAKQKWKDRVLIATGIRQDESIRRMGYGERVINRIGAQVWVNPLYFWAKVMRDAYLTSTGISRNPVSQQLGMSGECLCGAFAHPGEIEDIRRVCPATAQRIETLQARVIEVHPWKWGHRPPKRKGNTDPTMGPMCAGCVKSSIVQKELEE